MSKRAQLWSFIILGVIVLITVCLLLAHNTKVGDAELILDQKVEIIKEHYGMHNHLRASVIDRKGGYDETTGRYHYEFLIQKDSRPYALVIYDSTVDLTEDTVDQVTVEKPQSRFDE